jgi:WD40 repeat protein
VGRPAQNNNFGDHVKLLDFGLVCIRRSAARLTRFGVIVGTPGFLSPEQASGKPASARSDLFSLGVVLFLLATGTMPFEGEDVLAILTALAIHQPRSVFELNPDLPEALINLIMRLLSKEPSLRPGSAREVIDILAAVERQGAVSPAVTQLAPRPARGMRPRRQRIAWQIAGLAGLAVLLALAGRFLLSTRRSPTNDIQATPTTEAELPASQQHIAKLDLEERAWAAVFSPDGKYILSAGEDRVVRVWDVATGGQLRLFAQSRSPIRSLAFAGDGRSVVTGSGRHLTENKKVVARDCLVQVWDFADGKELARFDGPESPVASVAISGDGKRILSGGPWDHVRLWDVDTRQQLSKFGTPSSGCHAVAVSCDGKWGLFADTDPWVTLIDLDKAVEVDRFKGNASGRLRCVDFSPDGKQALSRGWGFHLDGGSFTPIDCTIRLWDMQTRAELKSFVGHGAAIASAVISPDGRWILSGGGSIAPQHGKMGTFDCSVRWWDIETGKELARFEGHTAPICMVAFSPDSRLGLSVGEDRTIRLWDLSAKGLPIGRSRE